MKVANYIKQFISRPAALRHVMHVILSAVVFLSENHYHTRLYFLECRETFQFLVSFLSQVAKGSDLYRADKSTKLCMVVA